MSDDVFKSPDKELILRDPKIPIKDLLNLKRLKSKIVNKSSLLLNPFSILSKHPTKKTKKARIYKRKQEKKRIARKKLRRRILLTRTVEHKEIIKMAVIHTNYPESGLSQEEGDLVRGNIVNGLIEAASRSWGSDLDIIDTKYEEGIFWVTCCNRRTVNWLWENVHSLGADSGDQVLFRVVESKFVPNRVPNIVQKVSNTDVVVIL